MNWTNWSGKQTRQAPDVPGGAPEAIPQPDQGPDLSFIPADFHTDGKPDLGKFTTHYQDLTAAQARAAERAALIPEDGNYEFALPEGFAIEGEPDFQFTLDPAHPLVPEVSAFLKEMGAPKEAGKQVAAMLAKWEASKQAEAATKWAADMKTLGTDTQVKARFDTVKRKLEGLLPEAEAKALLAEGATSAHAIRALERLLTAPGMRPGVPQPAPKTREQALADYYSTPSR